MQEELTAWSSRFGMPEAEFEERLYRLSLAWVDGRDFLLQPFFRYIDWTGTDQPWRMFAGPHRFPARFAVEELVDGDPPDSWRVLYVERDPEHAWHAQFLSQERIRSQIFRWGWTDFAGEASRGCDWLGEQRFAESAKTIAVRCRLYRAESPTPAQVRAHAEPEGHWEEIRYVPRPGLRIRPAPPSARPIFRLPRGR